METKNDQQNSADNSQNIQPDNFFNLKIIKKRENLFFIQTVILAILVIIVGITFIVYNEMEVEKGVKIAFAPFLSVVPLIFTLTIIKEWMKSFIGRDYHKKEILFNALISVIITTVFVFLTYLLSRLTAAEIMIAVLIAILSIACFVGIKVRNLEGMSILTGISEGIIIYMVFIF